MKRDYTSLAEGHCFASLWISTIALLLVPNRPLAETDNLYRIAFPEFILDDIDG